MRTRSNLRETVKALPCLACHIEPCGDAHHVTTRGAGGKDEPTNLMPLCRLHHSEVHVTGIYEFAQKYVIVKHWLMAAKRYTEIENNYERKFPKKIRKK